MIVIVYWNSDCGHSFCICQKVVIWICLNCIFPGERNNATICLNPFHVSGVSLYPVKTRENHWVSDNSRDVENDQWHEMS